MNQIWENGKKINFGPKFRLFGPSLKPQFFFFFRWIYLYYRLEIVASYHCIQFQRKRMIQTEEKGENPLFGSDLDQWAQIRAAKFFFQKSGSASH